jgi:hypothetical protein
MTRQLKFFLCKPEWLAAVCISLAIIWFHLFFWIHVGGFWRDEVNSINIASRHSLSGMSQDSFPMLMPLVVHGWLALGLNKSDLELRALGLLIGLGIPAVLWAAAWKTRRSPPLLGLTLFGLNSTLIVFGDSMRAYGLGCLLIISTTASACAFLKKTSWMRAGWLALFSVLSVQALYHNAILVGAICIGAMAVCVRRKNWRAVTQVFIAGTVAAISLLPYVPLILSGRESSIVLRTGVKLPRFYAQFQDSFGFPFGFYLYVWAFLALFMIICGCLVWLRNSKTITNSDQIKGDDLYLFAGITIPVGLGVFCIFLWIAALPGQSWYLLPVMAVAVTCFDAALPSLQRYWRAAFFGFIVVTTLISIPITGHETKYHLTNMDIRVRQLASHISADDYVIVLPWLCGISFEYYFKGATQWTTLPPIADHSTHRYDLVKIQLENTNAIAPVFQQINTTLQSGHRVWILASGGWMDFPDPRIPAPASLPPAPLSFSGWSEMPYTVVWASQIKHFLGDHSLEFLHVKNPTEGLSVVEQMELFMISGWKTNS